MPVSNLKKKPNYVDNKIFVFQSGDGFIHSIFHHRNGEEPDIINIGYLELTDVDNNNILIDMNVDNTVALINNEYEIIFENELGGKAFFDELFFCIEEIHNVVGEDRVTSTKHEINLADEIIIKGENNEKYNDSEIDKK